ncbi:MAG: hypothetical protein ACE15F_19275 [bacterium]
MDVIPMTAGMIELVTAADPEMERWLRRQIREHLRQAGAEAWVMMDGLQAVAVGGMTSALHRRRMVWLYAAPERVAAHPHGFYRTLKAEMERLQARQGITLECTVDQLHEAGHRLVRHLGFERVGMFVYDDPMQLAQIFYRKRKDHGTGSDHDAGRRDDGLARAVEFSGRASE